MKAKIILVLIAMLSFGCTEGERHFWYPVKLIQAKCTNFTGEVYIMTNSVGWRSWPYMLEKETNREITLPEDCVFRVIRELPVHKRKVEAKLTPEQKDYLVEGF